jgi:hypothetical protein
VNGLSEHLIVSVYLSSRWSFDQDNSTYSFYLYSVIVEALKVDSLQRLCSSLEPILRRVVRTKSVHTKRKYCSHLFMELLNVYWNFVFLSLDCNSIRLICRLVKKWSVPWENLVLLQSLGGMVSNQQWSKYMVKSQHVTLCVRFTKISVWCFVRVTWHGYASCMICIRCIRLFWLFLKYWCTLVHGIQPSARQQNSSYNVGVCKYPSQLPFPLSSSNLHLRLQCELKQKIGGYWQFVYQISWYGFIEKKVHLLA